MAETGEDIRYARSPDQVETDIEDQKVLLHTERWKYLEMNAIATAVWELLETPRTQAEIVETLLQTYDVDRETCSKDIAELMDDLEQRRFITRA